MKSHITTAAAEIMINVGLAVSQSVSLSVCLFVQEWSTSPTMWTEPLAAAAAAAAAAAIALYNCFRKETVLRNRPKFNSSLCEQHYGMQQYLCMYEYVLKIDPIESRAQFWMESIAKF